MKVWELEIIGCWNYENKMLLAEEVIDMKLWGTEIIDWGNCRNEKLLAPEFIGLWNWKREIIGSRNYEFQRLLVDEIESDKLLVYEVIKPINYCLTILWVREVID